MSCHISRILNIWKRIPRRISLDSCLENVQCFLTISPLLFRKASIVTQTHVPHVSHVPRYDMIFMKLFDRSETDAPYLREEPHENKSLPINALEACVQLSLVFLINFKRITFFPFEIDTPSTD